MAIRILSWNITCQTAASRVDAIADRIASERADLVLLQEVPASGTGAERLRELVGQAGLVHKHVASAESRDKRAQWMYGSAIFSRWPLTPSSKWKARVEFPETMARATVYHDAEEIDVFSVHIPNGSSHGWKKITHLLELGCALGEALDEPRLVAGDFNEPRKVQADGRVVPFSYRDVEPSNGREPVKPYALWNDKKSPEVTRELAWWDYGVRSVLDGERVHGLRHIYHDRHGHGVMPVTHRTRGTPRFFDHGFVSRHFEVVGVGYHHAWRSPELSDHSALWAELELRDRATLPALVRWSE